MSRFETNKPQSPESSGCCGLFVKLTLKLVLNYLTEELSAQT